VIGDSALEEPRGITVDPSGGTTIWIVDKKTDKVYQFDNATGNDVLGETLNSVALFPLAAGNNDPEGIADPPIELAQSISFTNAENRYDVNGDGVTSPLDLLQVINLLNEKGAHRLTAADWEGELLGRRGFYDVNGDDFVSPVDVLWGINYLNAGGDAKARARAVVSDLTTVDGRTAGEYTASAHRSSAGCAADAVFADSGALELMTAPAGSVAPVPTAVARGAIRDACAGLLVALEDDDWFLAD
jgi:hypothetical protein